MQRSSKLTQTETVLIATVKILRKLQANNGGIQRQLVTQTHN